MNSPVHLAFLALLLLAGLLPAVPAAADDPPSVRGNPELSALIASLMPAVVNINILKQRTPDEGATPQGEAMMTSPVKEYGSGFIIDPAGYIVTNRHVIAQAYRITVTFPNGDAYPAKVLATNEIPDLALLKIDASHPLPVVHFGDSSRLKVGQTVIAIGNPLGLSSSVSVGIVSALHRNVGESMFDDYIQTDAAINHGNSGGPLFDLHGDVIGVNWALIAASATTSGSDGLGLSIPANLAKWVVQQMREHGHINPGWIGVDLQLVTQGIAEAVGRSTHDGALVSGVVAGGGADGILREGDLILDFNGRHASDVRELSRAIASTEPGTLAPATVWRDGKSLSVKIKVAEWPAGPTNPAGEWVMPSRGRRVSEPTLGLKLEDVTPEVRTQFQLAAGLEGVAVVGVAANSPGADAGFTAGDVITRVQDWPVASLEQMYKAVGLARDMNRPAVLVLVVNQSGKRWLAVPTGTH